MKKFLLMCLCAGLLALLTACGGKIQVDKGDPNKRTTEKVSSTPTVTGTPTPTEAPENTAHTFSNIFLGGADSVWFVSKQEETDAKEYVKTTFDRVLYKHGNEITVYTVNGDAAEWFRLSDDEIVARAKAYPYVTFDAKDAMLRQLKAEEDEAVEEAVFLNAKAIASEGMTEFSSGGLFTIPAGEVFRGLVQGCLMSGFLYDGRETDIGINEQYYMFCTTDISYQLDEPGQVGTQFFTFEKIAENVKEARKGCVFAGTEREPYIDGCEVWYDPEADVFLITDRMFCERVIKGDRFWAKEMDEALEGRQYRYIHEGNGGYFVFDPSGFFYSPDGASEWLRIHDRETIPVPYEVYAFGNLFMKISIPWKDGQGRYYDDVRVGQRVQDETAPGGFATEYYFVKTVERLPITPDATAEGEFIVNGKDYMETYRKKIREMLSGSGPKEWTEVLYDSGEEIAGGRINIELAVRAVPAEEGEEAHVAYKLTFAYRSDVFSSTATEEYGG